MTNETSFYQEEIDTMLGHLSDDAVDLLAMIYGLVAYETHSLEDLIELKSYLGVAIDTARSCQSCHDQTGFWVNGRRVVPRPKGDSYE
jgi:hypothetical protein